MDGMMRASQTFKERDLARALRGLAKAGLGVARVEIDKSGKIVLILIEEKAPQSSSDWSRAWPDAQ
jgi:hypothetical protein